MADLYDLGDRSVDRDSFVAFLDALRADLRRELQRPAAETAWGAGDWAHPDLEEFFETLGRWLLDSDAQFNDLDARAWTAFAEMLLAARVYE